MPRPDKTDFDAQITTLNDEVQEYNEKLAEVDAKISDAKFASRRRRQCESERVARRRETACALCRRREGLGA